MIISCNVLLIFASNSFRISCITLRSLIHFELFLCTVKNHFQFMEWCHLERVFSPQCTQPRHPDYSETCLLDDSRPCQTVNQCVLPHLCKPSDFLLLRAAWLELHSAWLSAIQLSPFDFSEWDTLFFCQFLKFFLSFLACQRSLQSCWFIDERFGPWNLEMLTETLWWPWSSLFRNVSRECRMVVLYFRPFQFLEIN